MNLKEYSINAERTCPDLGSQFNNEMHMALGIATEAGELLDVYKKNFAYGKPMDYINVREEIGDLMWYTINLCRLLGVDLESELDINISKLRTRYPERFDSDHAINRDLAKERSVLEQ